jgi:hypothetical protein
VYEYILAARRNTGRTKEITLDGVYSVAAAEDDDKDDDDDDDNNNNNNNKNIEGTVLFKFKGCKSVHHRTIQINLQPDATIFQFIILTFIYSPTCFGRSTAHHQELNDCSSSL